MDDQLLTLRRYARAILGYWWLIALMTVLAAGVALVINVNTPATYEAKAQVLLSGPRFRFDLEPRMRTNTDSVNNLLMVNIRYQTIAQIAGSTEVESAVQ